LVAWVEDYRHPAKVLVEEPTLLCNQVDWEPRLCLLSFLQFHPLGAFRDLIVNVLEF